jgi:hypothetical protein
MLDLYIKVGYEFSWITESAKGFVDTLKEYRNFNSPSGGTALPHYARAQRRFNFLQVTAKQGNRMMRMLLVEAAQIAVRYDPEFRREYQHRCHAKPNAVAKAAAARKLAIRLYWILRTPEAVRIESSPRVPLVGDH